MGLRTCPRCVELTFIDLFKQVGSVATCCLHPGVEKAEYVGLQLTGCSVGIWAGMRVCKRVWQEQEQEGGIGAQGPCPHVSRAAQASGGMEAGRRVWHRSSSSSSRRHHGGIMAATHTLLVARRSSTAMDVCCVV
jgi:hypothetical protein